MTISRYLAAHRFDFPRCEHRATQTIDLNKLSALLGMRRLGFASTDRLRQHLGEKSGAVSVLSLIHDQSNAVELVIDQTIWKAEAIQTHPLIQLDVVLFGDTLPFGQLSTTEIFELLR